MGEDHEVVLAVAKDLPSARKAAQVQVGRGGRPYVDALTRIDMIDGYAIGLQQTGAGDTTETEGYNA